jgi:hypothetical protein
MKVLLVVLFLFIHSLTLTGQEKSKSLRHEFSFSISRTDLKDRNTTNLTGAGIGYLYIANNKKILNVYMGFSITNTRQVKKEVYETYSTNYYLFQSKVLSMYSNNLFAYSKDVEYSVNSFSIPVSLRFNFGKQFRAFAEAGCFIDVNAGTRKGTMMIKSDSYDPDAPWIGYKFEDNAWLTGMNYGYIAGLGFSYPVGKTEIITKVQYKKGLVNLGTFNNDLRNSYLLLSLGFRTNFNRIRNIRKNK